jgi:hypothetical protein
VAVAPFRVLDLTVWLAERLVSTNKPTINNSKTLPPINPNRSKRRRDLFSLESCPANASKASVEAAFFDRIILKICLWIE